MKKDLTKSPLQLKTYFLVQAIENDLTQYLRELTQEQRINKTSFLNDAEAEARTLIFYNSDPKVKDLDPQSLAGIQSFISFLSLPSKVRGILQLSSMLKKSERDVFKTINQTKLLYGLRTKVSHTDGQFLKEVNSEEFINLLDFSKHILGEHKKIFPQTIEAFSFIDSDPDIKTILNHIGPEFKENTFLINNAPKPNYFDTGFVGRQEIIQNVIQELELNTPIITIYGEGGLGKTALARKIIEQISNSEVLEDVYEVIYWHSSKQEEFTFEGLKSIDFDLLENIPKEIEDQYDFTLEALKEETGQKGSKILFVIDNLETELVKDRKKTLEHIGYLRTFGQLIITSRTRLGQLEKPIRITPFSLQETKVFLRNIAKQTNNVNVLRAGDEILEKWGLELNYSPLSIKLFAFALNQGVSAETFLSSTNKNDVNNFCFKNVFETLSERAKELLFILRQINRPASQFEILHLAKCFEETSDVLWDQDVLNEARLNLAASCFIDDEYSNNQQLTKINDLAKNFVRFNQRDMFRDISDSISASIAKQVSDLRNLPNLNLYGSDIFDNYYFILNDESSIEERAVAREIRKIDKLWKHYRNGQDKDGLAVQKETLEKEDWVNWLNQYREEKALELVKNYQKLEDSGAQSPALYRAWGLMLANANPSQFTDVIELFFRAYDRATTEKGKAQVLYNISVAYQRDKNYEEAWKFAQELNSLVDEPKAKIQLASTLHDIAKNEEANKILSEMEESEISSNRSRYLPLIFHLMLKHSYFEFNQIENLQDKLFFAENAFASLSKRINVNYIDETNEKNLVSLVMSYIHFCGIVYDKNGEKIPLGINTLFKENKYILDNVEHQAVLTKLKSSYPDLDLKKEINLPIRKRFVTDQEDVVISNIEFVSAIKSYGFIKKTEKTDRIFFHFDDVKGNPMELEMNSKVSFNIKTYKKRNEDATKAINITLVNS